MVRNRCLLYITVASWLLSPLAWGDLRIRSVHVSSDTTVRIKPYEPVFVVLDVTAESSANQGKMWDPPLELARRIVINDTEYALQFNANPVAVLSLDRSSIKQVNDDTKTFRVLAMLYWNIQENDYLFTEPGFYDVELYPGAGVKIIVEDPIEQERGIIAEIRDLGLDFAMFVMNPADQRSARFAPSAEQMLTKYRDTAYAKYLSISLGLIKLRAQRHETYAKSDIDLRSLAEQQVLLAREYFEPYCSGEIDSLFEAAAAYELAQKELDLVRRRRDLPTQQIVDVRRKAKGLFEKVKDSPYSLDFGPRPKTSVS